MPKNQEGPPSQIKIDSETIIDVKPIKTQTSNTSETGGSRSPNQNEDLQEIIAASKKIAEGVGKVSGIIGRIAAEKTGAALEQSEKVLREDGSKAVEALTVLLKQYKKESAEWTIDRKKDYKNWQKTATPERQLWTIGLSVSTVAALSYFGGKAVWNISHPKPQPPIHISAEDQKFLNGDSTAPATVPQDGNVEKKTSNNPKPETIKGRIEIAQDPVMLHEGVIDAQKKLAELMQKDPKATVYFTKAQEGKEGLSVQFASEWFNQLGKEYTTSDGKKVKIPAETIVFGAGVALQESSGNKSKIGGIKNKNTDLRCHGAFQFCNNSEGSWTFSELAREIGRPNLTPVELRRDLGIQAAMLDRARIKKLKSARTYKTAFGDKSDTFATATFWIGACPIPGTRTFSTNETLDQVAGRDCGGGVKGVDYANAADRNRVRIQTKTLLNPEYITHSPQYNSKTKK